MRELICLAAICAGLVVPALQAQETSPSPARPLPVSLLPPPEHEPTEGGGEREERRDEIETDRDSFTPALSTAGRGRLIFESAYTFLDNRGTKETHSFPEALLRYGLTDRVELRLGWNYEVGGAGNGTSGSGAGGEDLLGGGGALERETNIQYGAKFRVNEQRCWLPASSLILAGSTPTSGPDNHTSFNAVYVFGWDLSNRWKLDAAMRFRTDREERDHFNTWAPSVVLKAPVGERIYVHAEYFGLFSEGREKDFVKHYFSPGVHYLLTENLEVGFRVGWGLNDQSARFFANVGMGVRF